MGNACGAGKTRQIPVPGPPQSEAQREARSKLMQMKPYLGMGVTVKDNCVVIGGVLADMPASQSDLRVGDELVSVDGHPISNTATIKAFMSESTAGQSRDFCIRRDGADITIPVIFGGDAGIGEVLRLRRVAGEDFCMNFDTMANNRLKYLLDMSAS